MSALDKIDSIAVEKKAATHTSSVPEISLTAEQKNLIDQFVQEQTQLKEQEVRVKECQEQICQIGRNFLTAQGEKGSFTKSVKMSGNTYQVRMTQTDRFTIGPEREASIRAIMGDQFEKYFELKRTVSIKEEVLKDDSLLDELVAKFPGTEFQKYFKVEKKVVTKKGFDEKIYELPHQKREGLKESVKQAAPGITVI